MGNWSLSCNYPSCQKQLGLWCKFLNHLYKFTAKSTENIPHSVSMNSKEKFHFQTETRPALMYFHNIDLCCLWCFLVFFAYKSPVILWTIFSLVRAAMSALCLSYSQCNPSYNFDQSINYPEIMLYFLSKNHHKPFQWQKKLSCKQWTPLYLVCEMDAKAFC